MALKGYFVITDISGYTEYLTRSELDHANEILQSLFDAQLAAVQHPFIISGFRGDAIFLYVPETSFVQPQSLIEALENFYIVFSSTLEQMQYHTTCQCRACRNMSLLDLKMCVHYGEYLVQKLGDREELLGADVIVPHRMLKNQVIEKTQIKSYALYSESATEKLQLPEYVTGLHPHSEVYEHIGEVPMFVYDLRPLWQAYREKRRAYIEAKDAWVKFEIVLPYPPALIWEFFTTPTLEAGFLGYDYAERSDALGGRLRENAELHCAHGDLLVYSKILDWKPFEYYTSSQSALGLAYIQTRRLTRCDGGTQVGIYLSKPAENATDDVHQMFQRAIDDGYNGLGPFIEKDIASGRISIAAASN